MKVLHLFRKSQFIKDFMENCYNYFEDDHYFIVYGDFEDKNLKEYLFNKNVRCVAKIDIELRKPSVFEYMDSFDYIFYHGLYDKSVINFFYNNDKLMKKLCLYFWGGDIPLVGTDIEKKKKADVVRNACKNITIMESDYKNLQNIYKIKGEVAIANYCSDTYLGLMEKYLRYDNRSHDGIVNIQIGNSGTDTNMHFLLLDKLKKYKNDKLHIYVPMSYGDAEYSKKVESYGKEIFGKKITVISEYMEIEEYVKYIATIDVAIMGMIRQQALGNIMMLFANGTKVYLDRAGQNCEYFRDELKCDVAYIDDMEYFNFEEFVKYNEDKAFQNRRCILTKYSTDNRIKNWNSLFDLLRKNLNKK